MHHRRLSDAQRSRPPAPTEQQVPASRRRLLPVVALGGASAVLVAVAGPVRGPLAVPPDVGQAVVDLVLAALSLAALQLFVRRSVRTARSGGGPRGTAPWVVFAAAMAFYSVAQGRFAVIEVLAGGDPRREPATIACYMASAVPAPVAVVLGVRSTRRPPACAPSWTACSPAAASSCSAGSSSSGPR